MVSGGEEKIPRTTGFKIGEHIIRLIYILILKLFLD